MGEVQVRGFIEKVQVQFKNSSCTRRETMPPEWNTTLNTWRHIHSESTREFPHTVERRSKSANHTWEKQRDTQNCMILETKRHTVGNLPDVET